jgi:hypothetical protein
MVIVGEEDGVAVGDVEGRREGRGVGKLDGVKVGDEEGMKVGATVGNAVML